MEPGAIVEINKGVLRACLDGFAKYAFSGDIVFRYECRQIFRSAVEYHILDAAEPADVARDSVDRHWERIASWVNHNAETLLTVRFRGGKITRVDLRNREQRWELQPTE